MGNYKERTNDLVRAVHLSRKRGLTVEFPMQTADGEILFAVDKDCTLTADQVLGLLERGELQAKAVRKLVDAQAEKQAATPMRKHTASS